MPKRRGEAHREHLPVKGIMDAVECAGRGADTGPRREPHRCMVILHRSPGENTAVAAKLENRLAVPSPRLAEPVGVQQDVNLHPVEPEP